MNKKVLLLIVSSLLSTVSLGDTCPSIADVKRHAVTGWNIYDSEDGTLLSKKREAEFNKLAERFALAEWTINKKTQDGTIHCYYLDKTGSNLEAYLAKDHFQLVNNQRYWYQVSGFTQCAAGKEKCEFKKVLPQQWLAKK